MRATTLAPGQQAPVILDLPMGMHSGMEGPHLFRITVPVTSAAGESGTVAMLFKASFK